MKDSLIKQIFHRAAPLAVVLCLLALPLRADVIQNIEGLKLGYSIYLGGMHFMDSSTEFTKAGPVYTLQMKAGTQGFIRNLLPWDANLVSTGRIQRDRIEPKKGKVTTYWKDKPEGVLFEYKKEKGASRMDARFDPPQGKKTPGAAELGELDPLAGILQMMASFSYGKGCDQNVPIYDGHRRFDVVLEEEGTERLKGEDLSIFTGTAQKCVADFNMRGSDGDDREGSRFWEAVAGSKNRPVIYLYLAEVRPDLPPLPVRAVTETVFGGVVVHLSDVSGVKLKKSAAAE